LITHAENGENSIVVVPGANSAVTPELLHLHRDLLIHASLVLAQLEVPLATIEALASLLAAHNVPLMLDPAPARPLPASVLQATTWITPNETEAAVLLGHELQNAQPERIAERLLQMGPRNAVLKLGARGVFLAGKDVEPAYVPGFSVHAVDTTAAGDTFNAAFAARLVAGDAPTQAARYANAAAALSVQRMGAQPSMPTNGEVAAFLALRA
jgi:ribokinase